MAAIGAAATLFVISVVVWEAVQPPASPTLSARITRVQATASGHVATIEVANDGDDTAAAVEIEAQLRDETAAAVLDYVPAHGSAEAFLRFDADPRAARVVVRGWSAP